MESMETIKRNGWKLLNGIRKVSSKQRKAKFLESFLFANIGQAVGAHLLQKPLDFFVPKF